MAETILNVMFKFSVTGDEYVNAVQPLVDDFAELPGLQWKIWFLNEMESEAGGVYLFEDEAACNEYLEGPLANIVISHPALSDFVVKQFEVMGKETTITRGPIGVVAQG